MVVVSFSHGVTMNVDWVYLSLCLSVSQFLCPFLSVSLSLPLYLSLYDEIVEYGSMLWSWISFYYHGGCLSLFIFLYVSLSVCLSLL
jgi:hypothetical protein